MNIRLLKLPTRESVSRLKNRARYLSGSIAWTRVDPRHARERVAACKHAALYHHATLDLSSELGVGTTITVTFPIQQDEPFA